MESQYEKKISRFRSAMPQILAVSAKNLILFDMGMFIAFPTLVIPDVQNSPAALSLDDEQTSWFGSISMVCQPAGSVLAGLALERLGRKASLMAVNAPLLATWALFCLVDSPGGLLATSAVMGLGLGLVEAPILTYVAEISEPELRGVLTSVSELCLYVGTFCMYMIGTMAGWRTIAAGCTAVPILTVVCISQVPESPTWLVSRGRTRDAERALCWLRGWVQPAAVQAELRDLQRRYGDPGPVDEACRSTEPSRSTEKIIATDSPRYDDVLADVRSLFTAATLRPLAMVSVMSFAEHWSGVSGSRPYLVQVFHEFGLPIDAHWATVATALLSMFGVLVCVVAVSWCGKRPLLFLSAAGAAACCALLGGYAYWALPGGGGGEAASWVPLALFITLFFTHSVALGPMPWMLLSEVFPFRGRSLAAGTAAAVNYVFSFAASKTFLSLRASLGLHGAYWLCAGATAAGAAYLAVEFRETEGRSLHDIEQQYRRVPPFISHSERHEQQLYHYEIVYAGTILVSDPYAAIVRDICEPKKPAPSLEKEASAGTTVDGHLPGFRGAPEGEPPPGGRPEVVHPRPAADVEAGPEVDPGGADAVGHPPSTNTPPEECSAGQGGGESGVAELRREDSATPEDHSRR
ncbi:facilitated trehalose transporter Tret1-2 homolog [Bacillus rossius redtenbacheri]|uniref:facilitated trehalose transporter Tret1-2 homolog n=1 Tax=Bacillus rossius redtenbacheri TaxID=93214 RepID=UPI002FDEB59C